MMRHGGETDGEGTRMVQGGIFAPGGRFGERYRIVRLLGTGGMGAVYEAWDEQLDTPVALKLIRTEMLTDATARAELESRLKRELVLARQVTHRNVVRIHDLGEVNGTKYVSMPVIDGAPLTSVMTAADAVPLETVLDIARQILAGLTAVHEAGITHRDLKPENVMIERSGRVVLMDFGIARSDAPAPALTWPGAILGTLEYMAPEQAATATVDQRADLYSFGLLLYDLLGGRAARSAASGPGLARFAAPLPPVSSFRSDVPPHVGTAIQRCLELEPDHRYQRASEVAAALFPAEQAGADPLPQSPSRRTVLALAGVAAIAAAAWAVFGFLGPSAPPAPPPPLSILVANLDNRTGEPVFTGALEEALTIALEGAPFINTLPRADASRIAQRVAPGRTLDLATARLVSVSEGIDAVLGGAIARDEGGYRLELRLVEPASSRALGAAAATIGSKNDVLAGLTALVGRLRADLGDPQVGGHRAETFTTSSLDAVAAYTRAQQSAGAGRDEDAIVAYREAIGFDPAFGRAYSGWAVAASRAGRTEEAERAWKQALALLDRMTDRERYRTLGAYYLDFAHNYEGAVDTYGRLVSAYPADLAGHGNLALARFYLGDFAGALQEGQLAVERYPSRLAFRSNLALYALYAGRFDAAADQARLVLQQNAAFAKAYLPIATQALVSGDMAQAEAAYDQARQAGLTGRSLGLIGLADLAIATGDHLRAERLLREGIAFDEQVGNQGGAARKEVALAEALLARRQKTDAAAAARSALARSRSAAVVVPAATVLLAAGQRREADVLIDELGRVLQPRIRAFSHVLAAEAALLDGDAAAAVGEASQALRVADLWLARLTLARAQLAAGRGQDAVTLLEECRSRMGEAVAAFFDDVPTFRYAAQLTDWTARAQQAAHAAPAGAELRPVGTSAPRTQR